MSFLDAGWVAAAVYGFSGIIGLVAGGALADRLCRHRVDGRLIVGAGAIAICAPLMFLGLMRPAGDVLGFALFMGTGCGVMYLDAYCATVYSTLHDVVEPSLRGTAMALYFCAMYVLGASLGPVGTGLASDYFTFQAASAAGVVQPLGFGALMTAELRSLVGEAKGFDVRALEPFRAQGLHTAMYIVPTLETNPRGRAVRGIAHGQEGRRQAARLDAQFGRCRQDIVTEVLTRSTAPPSPRSVSIEAPYIALPQVGEPDESVPDADRVSAGAEELLRRRCWSSG